MKKFNLTTLLGVIALCGSATAAHAQTFTPLAAMCPASDFCESVAPLVQGTDGNLYGTSNGGANQEGAIFRVTPAGKLTNIYSFGSQSGDGGVPSSLLLASSGVFYGTTGSTLFKVTQAGAFTTLYTFCAGGSGNCPSQPSFGGLVQASDGNLYGTTYNGGASDFGTIYKFSPSSGTVTLVYSFVCPQGTSDCPDGYVPSGPLIQASDGNLYGATQAGGSLGGGTVFKFTLSGTISTVYNLCGHCSGYRFEQAGGVIQASNGELYGTTVGKQKNPMIAATAYSLTLSGKHKNLYTFPEGEVPAGPGIQATDGNFYGATINEGGGSTLYQMTPAGTVTTLQSFCDQCDVEIAAMVQSTNGKLYGTVGGSVFSLSFGLGPFVEALPVSGKVGKPVIILGTDLTGTSAVTFNGAPATFTVLSASKIKTTVPTGATTGTVSVTTPTGTLSSNVVFSVP